MRGRAGARTGRGCSWPRYWKRGQICRMSASCGRWSSQYAAAAATPAPSARARGRQPAAQFKAPRRWLMLMLP